MTQPVLLVTGASSGIGAACAIAAATAGYQLVLAARSADGLAAIAERCGSDALTVTCDVTRYEDQEAMVDTALARFGRIDAVFANAGHGAARGFSEDTTERWRSMVLTNVLGSAYTIRATLPQLRANAGHLILTSSQAGRYALSGSLYSATKWAVTGMADAVRQEAERDGVRVTVLEPGTVDTPFFPNRPAVALTPGDVADAFMFALSRPAGVSVDELLVKPRVRA